jgi:hypothetical protein
MCKAIFDFNIEIFSNGDDVIVFMSKKDLDRAMTRLSLFDDFGVTITVEGIARRLEDIFWCQCYLTPTVNGWVWVRNIRRVIGTISRNTEYTPEHIQRQMREIAYAELVMNPGQPLVTPLAAYICSVFDKRRIGFRNRVDTIERLRAEPELQSKVITHVTTDSRVLFAERYGLSSREQIELENLLIRSVANTNLPVRTASWVDGLHPHGLGWASTHG